MTKRIDWRVSFSIWAVGALLMIVFLPHARSANFAEPSPVAPVSFSFDASDLPKVQPLQPSANFKVFGELIERLDLLEVADAPASFVAALQSVAVVSTTEFPFDDSGYEADAETTGMPILAINSEASGSCRASGVVRSAYNYGAVAESECTCELYQRNPASRFGKATAKDFHWVKSCKKARYKAS